MENLVHTSYHDHYLSILGILAGFIAACAEAPVLSQP